MIQVHADGILAYDSRLEDYDLQTLTATNVVNKGGTAEIKMPPGHPAYRLFTGYKTIVEIRRDDVLRFRGRALLPRDDFLNNRTITCEGEFCFLRDAVSRPYLYQDSPENIFAAVIDGYNAQVEPVKQFKVGTITVTDDNDYIRLESESAETVQDTVSKLIERCGGYVVFTTDTDGARVINWYAKPPYRSGQTIEFGDNLLDFTRDGSGTDIATAILPYGAKNEETGQRLTIESVNDGLDYIEDPEAKALRGFILKTVTWDDVTDPNNLKRKAKTWLNQNKNVVTALSLTAVDLSYMDKNIDSYRVPDLIRVVSRPHLVDEDFLLTERTEDFLNPANDTISLGKEQVSLTGADAAGDKQSINALHRISHQIKSDYTSNIAKEIQTTELLLQSLIQQASDSITSMVAETYATNDRLTESISTTMTQLSDQFLFEFKGLKAVVDENDAESRANFEEFYRYIKLQGGSITLGAGEDAMEVAIRNDLIIFSRGGREFGQWDGIDFYTGNIVIEVSKRAQFGNFAFVPRRKGSLSFLKVGG